MAKNNNATDEPLANIDDERQAIRDELEGTNTYVLVYHGSEQYVALVNRDKAPSTEYPTDGETVVVVEWSEDDYALSLAEGDSLPGGSYEMTDELVEIVEKRSEAIETATGMF